MGDFELVFDKVILKQLKKSGKNNSLRIVLSKIFDKIEELGPRAGKLLDSQLRIYEVKLKHPPVRLYFKHDIFSNEIYIFEYEMKTSNKKQSLIIENIKRLLKS
jgi:hypothetical protein